MDSLGYGAVVFLCIVGVGYALWLLRDCCKRKQVSGDGGVRGGRRYRNSARVDWFLELAASATLLIAAGVFFGMRTHDHMSNAADRGSERCERIAGMQTLPRGKFSRDASLPSRPIFMADLSGLPIGDDEVCALIQHAPKLAWLNLTGTNVTDAGLVHLKSAPELTILTLGHTAITDKGMKHLAQLAKLEELVLFGTQITDAGLEHLRGAATLRELGLQSTSITDAGLESLQQIRCLETLELRNTAVTSKGVRRFREKRPCVVCEIEF